MNKLKQCLLVIVLMVVTNVVSASASPEVDYRNQLATAYQNMNALDTYRTFIYVNGHLNRAGIERIDLNMAGLVDCQNNPIKASGVIRLNLQAGHVLQEEVLPIYMAVNDQEMLIYSKVNNEWSLQSMPLLYQPRDIAEQMAIMLESVEAIEVVETGENAIKLKVTANPALAIKQIINTTSSALEQKILTDFLYIYENAGSFSYFVTIDKTSNVVIKFEADLADYIIRFTRQLILNHPQMQTDFDALLRDCSLNVTVDIEQINQAVVRLPIELGNS